MLTLYGHTEIKRHKGVIIMKENIRKCITNCLPKETTYLGEFLFLMPDTVWEGESGGQFFVAVAEDRWLSGSSGQFLAVTEDGSVYKGDLADRSLFQYCAASFPQFMEIMSTYQAVLETHQSPDVRDEEGLRRCEEEEKVLRETITRIDSTALQDDGTFWSVRAEEIGYGF